MVKIKDVANATILLLKLLELARPVNSFSSDLNIVSISDLNSTSIESYKRLTPCTLYRDNIYRDNKTTFTDCSIKIDQQARHILEKKPHPLFFENCYITFESCISLTETVIDKSLIEYDNDPECRSFVVYPSRKVFENEGVHYRLVYDSLSLSENGKNLLGNRLMAVAEQLFNKNHTPNAAFVNHCGISNSVIITKKGQGIFPGDQSCINEKNVIAGDDIDPVLARELRISFSPPDKKSIEIYRNLHKIDLSELRLFAKSAHQVLSDAIFNISGFDNNVTRYIEHLFERLLLKKNTSGKRVINISPGKDDIARYDHERDTIYINLDYFMHLEELSKIIYHELLHAAGMDHPPIILLEPTLSQLISMGLGMVIVSFDINNPINKVAIPHLTFPSTIEHLYLLISSGFDIEKAITILKGQYKEINNTCNKHLYLDGSLLEGYIKIYSDIPVANFTMVRGRDVQHPPIPYGYLDIHTYPFKKNNTFVVIGQVNQNDIATFSLIISNLNRETTIFINGIELHLDQTIKIRSGRGDEDKCIKTLLNIPQLPDNNNSNITNQSNTENEVASSGGGESTDIVVTSAHEDTTSTVSNIENTRTPDITPAPTEEGVVTGRETLDGATVTNVSYDTSLSKDTPAATIALVAFVTLTSVVVASCGLISYLNSLKINQNNRELPRAR